MLQSYNDTAAAVAASAEPMTVRVLAFTVVLMMLLAFILFFSGLVRMFGVRQTLNLELVVRVSLRVSFVLFLPVLASVFSLTKAQGGTGFLLTLLWLLLVELIRMKVQAMVLPADGSSFSRRAGRFTLMDNADEVGHMVWAGYLVFFNMGGHAGEEADKKWDIAMRAMFGILWLLSSVKLMQRIFNTWTEGRSWHTGRNPLLIAAYMQHVKQEEEENPTPTPTPASADAVMETCRFVVDGEHRLVHDKKKNMMITNKVVTTVDYGYGVGGTCPRGQSEHKHVSLHLDLPPEPDTNEDDRRTKKITTSSSKLVTVGKVWRWRKEKGDIGRLFSGRRGLYLEDLCLSFSLFKLLRRRFEQYPMVEVGSTMARRVMLNGLLHLQGAGTANRPFRVLQLELEFLQHYYLAADRTVMSPRLLFIPNIVVSMIFVPIYLLAILSILVSTKDADYFYCMAMLSSASGGGLTNFPFLCFFMTLALLVTLICFEAYEFFASYLSFNWNLVRLVCFYSSLHADQKSRLSQKLLYYIFVVRYWVFSLTDKCLYRHQAYTDFQIKQVSILDYAYGPITRKLYAICTRRPASVRLSTKAKTDILESMNMKNLNHNNHGVRTVSLPPLLGGGGPDDRDDEESGATGSTGTQAMAATIRRRNSATEIILSSHLATELFGMEHDGKKKKKALVGGGNNSSRAVATMLSRYCMYLVAHTPELLPDDEVWTSWRLRDMRTCLASVLPNCCSRGCMLLCRCCQDDTMPQLLRRKRHRLDDSTTGDAVDMLGKIKGWDQLAKFWVQLLVYLAPSNDVQGHAKAVAASGGDLISCLWALCTHAGITRQDENPTHG